MLIPVYLYQTGIYLTLIAMSFVYFMEERRALAMWIFIGWYSDFVFRANLTWFRIWNYPFGYVSFASIVFLFSIAWQLYRRNSHVL
jgi:hypothetical protein